MENKVDYIIVGDGYGALFFAHQLLKNSKSFVLFSEGKKSASHVSAGVVNPVVLKRFSTFWKAEQQIAFLKITMAEMSQYLPENYFLEENIHRIFHDEKERATWSRKRLANELEFYLDENFEKLDVILNPFETGVVHHSGRINVASFFKDFFSYLRSKQILINERFDHTKINVEAKTYNNISFGQIVFCEGIGIKNNIFFKTVPIIANKGHFIKVKLSQPLQTRAIIKKKHFLFPVDDALYYYGGTYDPEGSGENIDPAAEQQLISGLQEFYTESYQVEELAFGYRPTVLDRRPIVGRHPVHPQLFILNGLGARGILNGSYFAHQLFQHIEFNEALMEEVDLKRFLDVTN